MTIRRKFSLCFGPAVLLLTACGVAPSTLLPGPSAILSGKVHGGQQPVSGSSIQLYAASTTGSADGVAATPLITPAVTTDAYGNFTITSLYTCPSSTTPVYLTATGGNPGLTQGTNNPQLTLMTALGPCGNLPGTPFVSVNEVTTVAAVNALAPFMSSLSAVGSTAADAPALNQAFTFASQLANPATGVTPGNSVPAGYVAPSAEINTLADVIASCVNSTGGTTGTNNCTTLFGLVTPTGTPTPSQPTDTVAALLSLAHNPSLNTAAVFNLASSSGPFQPTLSQTPQNFVVALASATPPPALAITPSSVTFPTATATYPSAQQTVTIMNPGPSAATFSGISITGTNAADFSQVNSCASPLAAGASCQVLLSATPGALGTRTATLAVGSNASNSLQSVPLSVTGANPSAGPITLSVSSLKWTQAGPLQDIVVSNYGNTTLSIKSILSSDPSFIISTNTCGSTLPAQSICTLSIFSNGTGALYNPTYSDQSFSGVLTLTDDAAAGPQTVTLSSTNSTTVGISSFGAVPVGSSATGVVSASGVIHSDLAQVYGTVTGPNAGDFSPANPSCQGTGIPQSIPCTAPFTFTPKAAGLRTARYVTTSGYIPITGGANPPPTQPAFSVSITGTYPELDAIIGYTGYATGSAHFLISNNGNSTLSFSSFPIFSATPNIFHVSASCAAIVPGASCSGTITVGVQTGPAQYSGTLILKDTVSGTQQSLNLPVYAGYPQIAVNPQSYTFPTIPAGTSSTHTFTIGDINGNPLGHPATIRFYYQGYTPFSLSNSSCPASTSSLCTLTVTFAPTAQATYYPSDYPFLVVDTVSNSATYLDLGGMAGAPITTGAPAVTFSPSAITFPARPVGSTSLATTTTLTNTGTGNAPLTISSLAITGAVNNNFTQTNTCPASLATGASCIVSVTFAPTASGPQSAAIRLLTNAPTSPDQVTLAGTAQ